jgi:hypothetical protein
MSTVPRRDGNRPTFQRRSGIVSSAEIEAAVKASGIKDDDETTGPTGIRDNNALRKNAAELRDPQKKKKK